MMFRLALAGCFVMTMALVTGCEPQERRETRAPAEERDGVFGTPAEPGVREPAYQDRDQAIRRAETELQNMQRQIRQWREEAQEQYQAASPEQRRQLDEHDRRLEQQLNQAQQEFMQLRGAGAEAWSQNHQQFQRSLDELRQTYRNAQEALRQTQPVQPGQQPQPQQPQPYQPQQPQPPQQQPQ
jgi:DNA repair exonuclease SbcCD ATPase subunit